MTSVVYLNSLPRDWSPWSGLRLLQNDEWVTERLIELHNIPKEQRVNAKKQAKQIRFCILQAREYWDAWLSSTFATGPLQLYYCCMSLALAEILWRGDGNVSVDRLRQGQSHHGLTLSWSKNSLSVADLFEIKARPHVGAQGRNGTFDVWHKLTRENPIVGKVTDRTGENHRISAKAIFFGSTNRLPLISNDGISLEQLYAAMPRLSTALGSLNLQPKTVRATVEDTIYKSDLPEYQEKIETTLTVHPGNIDCINKLKSQLAFIPRSITDLIIVDGKDHFRVTQTWRRGKCGSTGGFDIPDAISIGARTTYFKPFVSSLNEFGIIYVTCFVLGNLCRYYPDLWMNELERHSGFSYLAQEFLTSASDRLPLVALATLTDSVYIQNDIGLSV